MDTTEIIPEVALPEAAPTVEPATPAAPALSREEIVAAATNNPALAKDEFILGGRTFKVVHLGYRQYMEFISKLEPLLTALTSKLTGRLTGSVSLPGIQLTDSSALLKFCADELPALTSLVCNMQAITEKRREDEVTAEWVEDVAEDPFQLVNIVAAQITKNNMIVKFASFFLQMLPMFQKVHSLVAPESK